MTKITLSINGMACSMCEAHMNDAIRNTFNVKKVSSSHTDKCCVIITENDIEDSLLEKAVGETGYTLQGIKREPYEKKGIFGFLKK